MKMMRRSLLAMILMVVILCPFALAAGNVGSMTLSQIQQRGTELTMYASLLDESGNQVNGLNSDQFSVWVDSAFQLPVDSVSQFDPATTGIHYVIAVDISKSITTKQMEDIRAGLRTFAQKLNGRDRVTLITFGKAFSTLLNQGTVDSFISQIENVTRSDNKTALYGGVQEAIDKAKSNNMRSVVIIITDGKNDPTQEMAGYAHNRRCGWHREAGDFTGQGADAGWLIRD